MKKILLYDSNPDEREMVLNLCNSEEIECFYTGDNSLDLCFEDALDIYENDDSEINAYTKHFLLMRGFSKEEFLKLDEKLMELNLSDSLIKISLTEHNGGWLLKNLFKEVEKEDRLYKKIEILRNLLDECNRLDYSLNSNEQRLAIQDNFLHAFILLNSRKINEEDVDNSIHLLEEQIQNYKNK